MIPNNVVLAAAIVPLTEPDSVDVKVRLRSGVRPSQVQAILDDEITTPTRSKRSRAARGGRRRRRRRPRPGDARAGRRRRAARRRDHRRARVGHRRARATATERPDARDRLRATTAVAPRGRRFAANAAALPRATRVRALARPAPASERERSALVALAGDPARPCEPRRRLTGAAAPARASDRRAEPQRRAARPRPRRGCARSP